MNLYEIIYTTGTLDVEQERCLVGVVACNFEDASEWFNETHPNCFLRVIVRLKEVKPFSPSDLGWAL
jgi:hypothetical protein